MTARWRRWWRPCRRRGRTPRLEYFPALAPAVAPRLRAAGFAVEGRLALMTRRLTAEAFARGATTVFLTPAGPDEARIYQRVGFTEIAEQVHTSLPIQ